MPDTVRVCRATCRASTSASSPLINLAIVWHQHQPLYRDLLAPVRGSIRMPWVRLHAIRDYFSMAQIVSQYPGVRVTINWSPSLLLQIEDQLERGATDEAWELSRIPAERLNESQKEAVLSTFFDADWHNQIFPHARYRALFEQRRDRRAFSAQDLRDLQIWFNLACLIARVRVGGGKLLAGAAHCMGASTRESFAADPVTERITVFSQSSPIARISCAPRPPRAEAHTTRARLRTTVKRDPDGRPSP